MDVKKTALYDELEKSRAIQKFLDELLGKYSKEELKKPYAKERIAAFWTVLRQALSPEEEQLLFNLIYGLKDELNEKEQFLYILACAKLRGDAACVKDLYASEEATKFLGKRAETFQNKLLYKEALERIQRREKGPWSSPF